jgi:lipopolysaccharide transport system permease protein
MAEAIEARTSKTVPVLELNGESVPMGNLIREIWRGRKLATMLASRDFRSKYRSSNLGLLWSILLPFVQGAVLAVVFTHVVKSIARDTGVNYPIYILLGTTLWGYFQAAFAGASTAIVGQSAITGRLYFPRVIVTAVPVLSGLPTYGLSIGLLMGMMGFFNVPYHWNLLALPIVALLAVMFTIALAASIAILHVYVRDVSYGVTAGLQIWYYLTPIIYPMKLAHSINTLVVLNPMTGIVQLAHWCIFGRALGALRIPLISTVSWIVVLTIVTLFVYRRYERVACDRL